MRSSIITDYTQLYNSILSSLTKDNVPQALWVSAAKKITDSIWDLSLALSLDENNLVNTRAKVIEVINNL